MSNKVVVVTGGASGIGLATCQIFAKNNFDIVLADVNDKAGQQAVEALKLLGVSAIYQHTDVSKPNEVEALIDKAVAEYGKIDVLVNNAGIAPPFRKAADHTLEDWNKVIAINLGGVFYGLKYGTAQMLKQGSGNIVNVASLAGIRASHTGMAYSASKHGVVGMTKSAALEYGKYQIRINCICPSITNTPILDDIGSKDPVMKAKLLKAIPLRRYGEPEEMAKGILWLATENSSFVTGHSLIIDGGMQL